MAKPAKTTSSSVRIEKPKRKRPNVHAKSQSSKLKKSKCYKKRNKGQGRN